MSAKDELKQWQAERENRINRPLSAGFAAGQHRERAHKLFYRKYDEYLDKHANVRWLEQDSVANVIRENLYHHHERLYELIAWCVMPNHVHAVIQPFETALSGSATAASDGGSVVHVDDAGSIVDAGQSQTDRQTFSGEVRDRESVLSRIMHSLKSYTANRANELLARDGRFWQRESYDHWIRDVEELERIVDYIRWNPVTAGLCQEAHEWPFSSAFDRYQRDGSRCGLVGWLTDEWRR